MMSKELGFFGRYMLLLIIQLLLCNYFMMSPYMMLTLLPAMVLSIPLRYTTPQVLLIAFGTALAVDLISATPHRSTSSSSKTASQAASACFA